MIITGLADIHNKSRVGHHTGAMRSGLNYGEIIRVSMVLLLARLLVKSGINPYSLASIVRHQVMHSIFNAFYFVQMYSFNVVIFAPGLIICHF